MEEKKNQNLIDLASQIKSYVLTEKVTKLHESAQSQYAFIVDPSLRKPELKGLLELLFAVKIDSIRTINLSTRKKKIGKFLGKKSKCKKVYITLKENNKIENLIN
jgi:large subunit ribosomal protein L23